MSVPKSRRGESPAQYIDLAFMTVNHEKIPPSVLKQWVGMITDEISQISKIKRSDKGR